MSAFVEGIASEYLEKYELVAQAVAEARLPALNRSDSKATELRLGSACRLCELPPSTRQRGRQLPRLESPSPVADRGSGTIHAVCLVEVKQILKREDHRVGR